MHIHQTLRAIPLLPFFFASTLFADNLIFVPAESDQTRIQVEGTSNVRDWDAESAEIKGSLEIKDNGFWQAEAGEAAIAPELVKGQVTIQTETLTSGSRGLTSNLHKYMDASKYPQVEFEVTGLKPLEQDDEREGLHLEMEGRLTVKGEVKEIAFPVEWSREGDQLRITGRADMKMTDFGIDPPRQMMGAIRAADEVTITFNWVLTQKKS